MPYTGKRPILPGQNVNDLVHPHKGVGRYSYWANYTQTQLLEDAPLEDHTPGEGRHPGDYAMSRWFLGVDVAGKELADSGKGTRIEGGRFRPWEYKGLNDIFVEGYGHPSDEEGPYATWSNWQYEGLADLQALADPGNGETAATFGVFKPWEHESRMVTDPALKDGGQTLPDGVDGLYGRARVNEHFGVVKAL